MGSYNDVKDSAECAVNSALGELNDSDSVRKERVSEILPQVSYMDQISTGYVCNDETTAYFRYVVAEGWGTPARKSDVFRN